MDNEVERTQRRGITRRDVIKGGAVLGGVVWAAPVIDSFASPSSALSQVCPPSTICTYADCDTTLCASTHTQHCTSANAVYQLACQSVLTGLPGGGSACVVQLNICCCSAGTCPAQYTNCSTHVASASSVCGSEDFPC